MATELSKIINHWVSENSKVIDFGCGDGSLLKELIETKNILGYGVEIKAVSYHQLLVEEGPPSRLRVILDL